MAGRRAAREEHEVLGRLLSARAKEFCGLAKRCSEPSDPGEEWVHDTRVAGRRLAEAVGLLAAVLPKGYGKLRRRVREVVRQLGGLRDFHIFGNQTAGDFGHGLMPPEEVLSEAAALMNAKARRRLEKLSDRRHVERLLRRSSPDELRQVLGQRFGETVARFFERAEQLSGDPPEEEMHRLRIAGKHLRYALEIVLPGGRPKQSLLGSLRELQGTLGAIHDAFTVLQLAATAQESKERDRLVVKTSRERRRLIGDFLRKWTRARFGRLRQRIEKQVQLSSRLTEGRV